MKKTLPKKVKIIATIGPASDSEDTIMRLAKSGVNIFRINLSHSDKNYVLGVIEKIRKVERNLDSPVAIFGDLVGPKIRIGTVEPGAKLVSGQRVRILSRQTYGNSEEFSINFPAIIKNLSAGAEIYLGDGEIKLEVESRNKYGLVAKTIVGGSLRDRMGFSAHGISLRFPLTEKDQADIDLISHSDVDGIAVSFVQTRADIEAVKKLLPKKKPPMIIAKIETLSAVENAAEIMEVSDAMMIARGDLGFSVPLADLPHIQKNLIDLCRKKSKPVITATQMLESMITNYLPTRAEVTDVANAILDGTDTVMLSAETAIGKFPVETVQMMTNIIRKAEDKVEKPDLPIGDLVADAVSSSTINIANQIGAKAIVVFTQTGYTARLIARHRPSQIILALSPDQETIRKLSFSRGVFAFYMKTLNNFSQVLNESRAIVKENSIFSLKDGEYFVISAGAPFGKSGTTNLVWVNKV